MPLETCAFFIKGELDDIEGILNTSFAKHSETSDGYFLDYPSPKIYTIFEEIKIIQARYSAL